MPINKIYNNVAFKCAYNDRDYKEECSEEIINYPELFTERRNRF
jgi:hypothetical protein